MNLLVYFTESRIGKMFFYTCRDISEKMKYVHGCPFHFLISSDYRGKMRLIVLQKSLDVQ
jgi:hypothetical protein